MPENSIPKLRCKTISGNRDYSKSRRLEIQLPDNLTENEAGIGWEMTKNGQKPAQRKIGKCCSSFLQLFTDGLELGCCVF